MNFFYNFISYFVKIASHFRSCLVICSLFILCSYDSCASYTLQRICLCWTICMRLYVFYVTCSAVSCMRLNTALFGSRRCVIITIKSYTSNSKKENMFFVLFCSECFLFLSYYLYVFICVFGWIFTYEANFQYIFTSPCKVHIVI